MQIDSISLVVMSPPLRRIVMITGAHKETIMAKIAYAGLPAHGHTNPTLPVMRELVQHGYEVNVSLLRKVFSLYYLYVILWFLR